MKADVLVVIKACSYNPDAVNAFARVLDVYLATKERAERAEVELVKLKAELAAKEVANGSRDKA